MTNFERRVFTRGDPQKNALNKSHFRSNNEQEHHIILRETIINITTTIMSGTITSSSSMMHRSPSLVRGSKNNSGTNSNTNNRLLFLSRRNNELSASRRRLRANADSASSSSSEGSGVAFERLVEPLIKTKKEDDKLNEGIAAFYDQSTPLWEEIWGDHLHHGYYPNGSADGVDPEPRKWT